jgi:hypothetical protein
LREADAEHTDLETAIGDLLSDQYKDPTRAMRFWAFGLLRRFKATRARSSAKSRPPPPRRPSAKDAGNRRRRGLALHPAFKSRPANLNHRPKSDF